MAYNQDKSIIIVDTQSWEVKKTLTDEKVILNTGTFLVVSIPSGLFCQQFVCSCKFYFWF